MEEKNLLDEARKIINEVDAEMAELFVKRMRATEMVYEHKKEFGLPILDQTRENEVIEKNIQLIEDEVLKGYYIDYIKNMMSISRAYQYRMQSGLKIAYSGVEGAFAHIAAGRIFPDGNRISYPDFRAAYEAVEKGEVDLGIAFGGTGNGMQMYLNKHQGIRAGLCWSVEIGKLIKQHNNANVLVMPARFIPFETVLEITDAWLDEPFEGGRHQGRIDKIPVK